MIIGNIIIAKNVKKNKPINRIRRNSNNKNIFFISLKKNPISNLICEFVSFIVIVRVSK